MTSGLKIGRRVGEEFDRLGNGVENREHAMELCDLHHILGAAGGAGEHHLTAAVAHAGQSRHQHADAKTVEPRRIAQAHHELAAAFAHLQLHVLLKAVAGGSFAHHLTVQLDDLDAA